MQDPKQPQFEFLRVQTAPGRERGGNRPLLGIGLLSFISALCRFRPLVPTGLFLDVTIDVTMFHVFRGVQVVG
jgi:hypothetical protein